MASVDSMTSGVCSVSVDVLDGQLHYRVMTVYLASRDLHSSRITRVECFTDPGQAIAEVAAFVRGYQASR